MEIGESTIKRWVQGDDDAFREIFRTLCREVYWLALKILQNDAAAEDVVQETFLRIHGMRRRVDPSRPLRPLLLRIAGNCAIDSLRRLRPEREEALEEEPEDRTNPHGSWVDRISNQDERQEHLRKKLATLPAIYRGVLVLRYAHELSYKEIAAALQLSLPAVALRLKRGKELLRQRMTSMEVRN